MKHHTTITRLFYWLLPIGWMGVIYFSSAQPYEDQNIQPFLKDKVDLAFLQPFVSWIVFTYHNTEVSVSALGVEGVVEFFIRKGAHVSVFFILMCLFFAALTKTTFLKRRTRLIVSFLGSVAYAGIDEFHQSFTANRTPYIGDVALDSLGALLAGILLWCFVGKARRKNKKNA